MDEINPIESMNFHGDWLKNIYENIKKIEEYQRIARTGCASLMEYIAIPDSRKNAVLIDLQYKNLTFIVAEFDLLVQDLIPVLNDKKDTQYLDLLGNIKKVINNRALFIVERYNSQHQVISIQLTGFFWETFEHLVDLKVMLFKDIKHILYMENTNPWR